MKTKQFHVMMVSAALVLLSGVRVAAQNAGGGNPDPAQLQQRIGQFQQRIGQTDPGQLQQMAQPRPSVNLRVQLQVTDDDEWSVIEPLIQKVLDAQQAIQADHMGGATGQVNQIAGQLFGAGLVRTNPEVQAVGNAVQSDAPSQEIKAALANLMEARKAHLAALEKAQDDLRKVLTLRQEAVATVNGLL